MNTFWFVKFKSFPNDLSSNFILLLSQIGIPVDIPVDCDASAAAEVCFATIL
jgi:hypothetical protein